MSTYGDAVDRLSVVDEIFLRTHRGLGTPIVLQGLWRTADRIDPELLRRLHAELSVGPLGRRVIRPRVPGARRGWRPNIRSHALELSDEPIPVARLLDWADGQGNDLDPESGPGWRLAATALDDGGTLVALTCSHVLADGRALALAVDIALRAIDTPDSADSRPPASPVSDWADARRQWWIVLRGTARALRNGIPRQPAAAAPDERAGTGLVPTVGAVLQCPSADWDRVAATAGGTANSLFIYLVAKALWDSGFPNETIEASLPVDTRAEPRVHNDLAMTSITVDRIDNPATIREKARAAYESRMSSPGGMPEELLQLIPDRLAYALSRGAGERDILCSNIGTLPDSLRALGPHRCVGVAARAIHPGLDANHLPRTRLSGYLTRIDADYTMALVGLDPAHIRTTTELRDLIRKPAAELGLPLTFW
ncbi:hypothetical protein [Nocardia arthritidis]|uniref:Condensation domain-containing protein n=1 Tax=Nocardia arthritidis TaxID=228602 RepID=A0A6G9YRM5_9NOCA|nr:hypothetical protein [Nocardia arthritidis]QIS15872.1 hypothetical protein F5544_40280 [Nocardia arthritidis]